MIRTRPSPIAALAVLVAGILATAACGGSGGGGAGATAAPDTAEAVVTTPTVPAGACTERAPNPKPDPKSYPAPPPQTIDTSHAYTATLATSCGDIVIALDPAEAPVTVEQLRLPRPPGVLRRPHLPPRGGRLRDPGGRPHRHRIRGRRATRSTTSCRRTATPPARSPWPTRGPNTNGSQFFIVTGRRLAPAERLQPFREGHRGPRRRRSASRASPTQRGPRRSGDPEADPADLHLPGHDHRDIGSVGAPMRARIRS